MKKTIIGSLVGAIILFIWQFLSWGPLNFHRSALDYTPKQDSVLNYLSSQFSEDHGYLLPNLPKTASNDDYTNFMKQKAGKPWVIVTYHSAQNANMGVNMLRGFLVNLVVIWLLCWIIGKSSLTGFSGIFLITLGVGLIGFLNLTYTNHVWYHAFDLHASLIDTIVSWGLIGIWLGYYLKKAEA